MRNKLIENFEVLKSKIPLLLSGYSGLDDVKKCQIACLEITSILLQQNILTKLKPHRPRASGGVQKIVTNHTTVANRPPAGNEIHHTSVPSRPRR